MLFVPAGDKNGSGSPASSAGVLPSDESSSASSSGASDAYPSPAFSDSLSLPDVDSSSSASDPSRLAKSSAGKRSKRKKGNDDEDDDDESSTTYRMSRDRAPSVGLDGPLFGDETDGATTPGTDSDASDYMSAAARGPLPGADDFAGHNRSLRGDGVPRGGFKLGLTEVNSSPAAAPSATATDE